MSGPAASRLISDAVAALAGYQREAATVVSEDSPSPSSATNSAELTAALRRLAGAS